MRGDMRLRIDQETLNLIDDLCKKEECTRSELIRYIIHHFISAKRG